MCQECDTSSSDVAASLGVAFTVLGVFVAAYVTWKRWARKNRSAARKILDGAKILFVTHQILAGLPAVIPGMALPENFKGMLESLQFVNLNLFQVISVGCYSGGFDFFSMLIGMTLAPAAFISILWRWG